MNIVVLDSKHWPELAKHGVEKRDIEKLAASAAEEVSKLIPFLPSYTNLVLNPSRADDVIPETGVMGMTYSDEYASVFFDYEAPYGKEKLLEGVRATILHELVHATTFHYDPWQPSAMFGVVTEGLATVFERDYAEGQPLWGKYENDSTMHEWLRELQSLPESREKNREYFVSHPDGRKWIVYKTGTWLIDKLVASGEDLFELMKLDHKEVIAKFENLHEG